MSAASESPGPGNSNTVNGSMTGVMAGTVHGDVVMQTGLAWPQPGQLPGAPAGFVGRELELAALSRAVDDGAPGSAVVISALNGVGGVGKTWLAVHWAHQNLERFPDGQLFVDLRGFDPRAEPMAPREAVRGFLNALDVPAERIPAEEHAQVGLYRSLVRDRRMLVLLDNARDGEQVRDLLPGSASCTVLITSRDRLGGLLVGTPFQPLEVRILDDAAARALLAGRLGEARLAAEPEATEKLVRWCAGLPLALGIVAARAVQDPTAPLAKFAGQLQDESVRLAALDGRKSHSVDTLLSCSYRALPAEQARVFALLGLAPGQDIGVAAAASLVGWPVGRVELLLDELVEVSLVQREHERYRMHDLVRLYASEVAAREVGRRDRELAVQRLLDFYCHTAHSADLTLAPHHMAIELSPLLTGCQPAQLDSAAEAAAWFAAEQANLLAAQQLAVAQDRPAAVWQLAWTMTTFNLNQGYLRDNHAMWVAGVAAAADLDDPIYRIQAHRHLGRACAQLGQHDEALRQLELALAAARAAGDRKGQAHTHRAVAEARAQLGDYPQALANSVAALRLYEELGVRMSGAHARNEVGWYTAQLGDLNAAREHCAAALAECQEHNSQRGIRRCLLSLGFVAHRAGSVEQAVEHYRQALALCRAETDAATEADVLVHLGDALLGADPDGAREAWTAALSLLQKQRRGAEAERVRERLGSA